MPLVRIDVLKMEPEQLGRLADAVQQGIVETVDVPAEDRFQILTNHDGDRSTLRHCTWLDVPRDDGIAFVDITLRAGRTDEQKTALYARVCELAEAQAEVAPHNVFIVLHENTPVDWSLGYGRAQFVDR